MTWRAVISRRFGARQVDGSDLLPPCRGLNANLTGRR
jgi:hypothetical protein